MTELTVLGAVAKALGGRQWLTESELVAEVYKLTGRHISGSNVLLGADS
jgi:hypothetical protein